MSAPREDRADAREVANASGLLDVLLWLDVETTGLETTDKLLEVAAVATTFDADLTPLGDPFSVAIQLGDLRFEDVSPLVFSMHARSGLWDACRSDEALSLAHASARFSVVLHNWGLFDVPNVYLAGRSVHFDRSWLPVFDSASSGRLWLSRLSLSHRHFDLTSIKAFATLAGIPFAVPEDAHRALDDIYADIALTRALLDATAERSAAGASTPTENAAAPPVREGE